MNVKYFRSIDQIKGLSIEEKEQLKEVTNSYVFRANDYYLNLIDWVDPDDPIRRLIIPSLHELKEYGRWDASDEEDNYVVPGCQHKYQTTALLLVSNVCGAYCRYCFRKRLFQTGQDETITDIEPAIQYIQNHPSISNVLLTGGDPLTLSTSRLRFILQQLSGLSHVQIIRIGTKMPVFNPMRFTEDSELQAAFNETMNQGKKIYVVMHINHPREITEQAMKGFYAIHQTGAVMVNQTPILKGINDDPEVLAELLDKLTYAGVAPYYFFVNRPVIGNADFVLPLKIIYDIVESAKSKTSGLGKRVRLVMSHSTGKIEILGITDGQIYLKYHQSKSGEYGKMIALPCPETAAWYDDLLGHGS
ncbi:KamA family radical SAM protein [Paenibacillus antri]|uniref:KamA family radical SAM protein n=1 Tax=Paenibacillus antri TaxID=2582848 RepID=A0A5R9G9D5_9BACL|nr:KamA family radical SAM protein [Paenibacillus antri]TLS49998.1 KamA family radical SAM protein [Paenibacillus antri]